MKALKKNCDVCETDYPIQMKQCRRCRVHFHKLCYPTNLQICDLCKQIVQDSKSTSKEKKPRSKEKDKNKAQKQQKKRCFICQHDQPKIMKYISPNKYAHIMCYVSSPIIKIRSFISLEILTILPSKISQKCKICKKKTDHLLYCQLCEYVCHQNCITIQDEKIENSNAIERFYIGNDLSKFQNSKNLLVYVSEQTGIDLKQLFGIVVSQPKKLMICQNHDYKEYCWCYCGNSSINDEKSNPSVVCDGCSKYVHLSCTGLNKVDQNTQFFCKGCQQENIFKKNFQLPELLENMNRIQTQQTLNDSDIKLLVAFPFNYSERIQAVISENAQRIILYYIENQIVAKLQKNKPGKIRIEDDQLRNLIGFMAQGSIQKQENGQYIENLQEKYNKYLLNIGKLLNQDMMPNASNLLMQLQNQIHLYLDMIKNEKQIQRKHQNSLIISINENSLQFENNQIVNQRSPMAIKTEKLENRREIIDYKKMKKELLQQNSEDQPDSHQIMFANARFNSLKKKRQKSAQKLKNDIYNLQTYKQVTLKKVSTKKNGLIIDKGKNKNEHQNRSSSKDNQNEEQYLENDMPTDDSAEEILKNITQILSQILSQIQNINQYGKLSQKVEQISSKIEKGRSYLLNSKDKKIKNIFKSTFYESNIKKLSFVQIMMIIPVNYEVRKKLVQNFCFLKGLIIKNEPIPQEVFLELSDIPYLIQQLGFKNRRYLKALRYIFSNKLKNIRLLNRKKEEIEDQTLSKLIQSYLLQTKGRTSEGGYHLGYETIRVKDILILDESVISFLLLEALAFFSSKLSQEMKIIVTKFFLKAKLLFHLIIISSSQSISSYSMMKQKFKQISIVQALKYVQQNFGVKKKYYRCALVDIDQVIKAQVKFINSDIHKTLEKIVRLTQKYIIQQQKCTNYSVMKVLSLAREYYSWPIIHQVQFQRNQQGQIFQEINKYQNIPKALESFSETNKLLAIVQETKQNLQKSSSSFKVQLKRLKILAGWCTMSLGLTNSYVKKQKFTMHDIVSLYEAMKKSLYPSNKVYQEIYKLYNLIKELQDFCCKTLKKARKAILIKFNICDFSNKLNLVEVKNKLKLFKEIPWQEHNIVVELQIIQIQEQINRYQNNCRELQTIIKQNKIVQPNEKNFQFIMNLKNNIESSAIKMPIIQHYYKLVREYNYLLGKFMPQIELKKKIDDIKKFWIVYRDRVSAILNKKLQKSEKQWIKFIPDNSDIIRNISENIKDHCSFHRIVEDNETYLQQVYQTNKKSNKDNFIEIGRFYELQYLLDYSIFNNQAVLSNELCKIYATYENYTKLLSQSVPYLEHPFKEKYQTISKHFLETSQLYKGLKNVPIKDELIYLYERDMKALKYLRTQTNRLQKQEQLYKIPCTKDNKKGSKKQQMDGFANLKALSEPIAGQKHKDSIEAINQFLGHIKNISKHLVTANSKKISQFIEKLFQIFAQDFTENIDCYGKKKINKVVNKLKLILKIVDEDFEGFQLKEKEKMYSVLEKQLIEVNIYLTSIKKF